MGTVFGSEGISEPAYSILQSTPFEIRNYSSYLIAEVAMQGGGEFNILAKYIGVFGEPANEGSQAMAMTAPVLEGVSMAMTAPVLQSGTKSGEKMAFVLPFEYTDLAQAPRPTDNRVTLRDVPEKVVAIR
jgi:hypothetical protein